MIISISGKIGTGKDTVGEIIQYLVWRNQCTNKEFPPISEKHFEEFRHSLIPDRSNWKIVKFADKLKDMVCILLGCTRKQLEDREFKEKELGEEWWHYRGKDNIIHPYLNYDGSVKNKELICSTPRLLLQLIGTQIGRNIIHTNIWVNATMVDYKPNGVPYNSLGDLYDDLKHCPSQTKNPDWIITDTRFPNEADAVKSKGGINIRLNRLGDGILGQVAHASETALDNYTFDYVIDNNGTIEDLIIKVKEILIKENIL